MSACFFRALPKPKDEGPAKLIRQGRTYHAFFPGGYQPLFHCGTDSSGQARPFAGRFTPQPALFASRKADFRGAYRNYLLDPVKEMHPDSTSYAVEHEGEVAVGREVSKEKYLRLRRRRFERTVEWDRQYMGFINRRGDSILVVNMVDPRSESFDRRNLAEGWFMGFDGAADDHTQVAYHLAADSVGYVCDTLP
jgi:hypothetical protein